MTMNHWPSKIIKTDIFLSFSRECDLRRRYTQYLNLKKIKNLKWTAIKEFLNELELLINYNF